MLNETSSIGLTELSEVQGGYTCPVCGFAMANPPLDFNICPSCGTEFGNDDVEWTVEQLRAAWFDSGSRWWSRAQPRPKGWKAYQQVLRVIPPSTSTENLLEMQPSLGPTFELGSTWVSVSFGGPRTTPCLV